MSEALHPNVVRVVEAARALGLEITPRRFPDGTKTAADAAAAIGVELGPFREETRFGSNHVDAGPPSPRQNSC